MTITVMAHVFDDTAYSFDSLDTGGEIVRVGGVGSDFTIICRSYGALCSLAAALNGRLSEIDNTTSAALRDAAETFVDEMAA